MNEDEKLSIRVSIGDRYYPLRIDRNEEEKIRKAAKIINDKVIQYKQRYRDKDAQDFLAMAALQFVTRTIELESQTDTTRIETTLAQLNSEMELFIRRETQE